MVPEAQLGSLWNCLPETLAVSVGKPLLRRAEFVLSNHPLCCLFRQRLLKRWVAVHAYL